MQYINVQKSLAEIGGCSHNLIAKNVTFFGNNLNIDNVFEKITLQYAKILCEQPKKL